MTRQEKHEKRKQRALRRKEKRNAKYRELINTHKDEIPTCGFRGRYPGCHWVDSSSPTGYSQFCDWSGICQYPCNGDC